MGPREFDKSKNTLKRSEDGKKLVIVLLKVKTEGKTLGNLSSGNNKREQGQKAVPSEDKAGGGVGVY